MDKLEALKHYFGHDAFRAGQEAMVDALLTGRDALGVMPTGAGKSICYQIPALLKPGIALVISPLISLMKDQVAALKLSGVPAAYINSSLTPRQMELATERACQGQYKIIYVAPERLESPSFLRFAQHADISLLAVDEAHCVSQWGQDFRPNYLRIADFVNALPRRPVIGAFTATATARVKDDIVRLLALQNPVLAATGFDRPNLFFEILPVMPKQKLSALSAILRHRAQQSGIVYCATRKSVEEVSAKLAREGLSVARYHAGLPDDERRQNQEDFQYDRVQIMVATNAFGMGIDKSNVNFVIHYNMPKSMEAYYQEAGRAGRDGEDAVCIMLYHKSDYFTCKWMIEHSEPNDELTSAERDRVRRQDMQRLSQMIDYCESASCLRHYILHYFGEESPEKCEDCSNCVGAQYAFAAHVRQPAKTRVNLQASAGSALTESLFAEPPRPPKPQLVTADPDNLFELLRACRANIAQSIRMPAYIVCDDKTLDDMVRLKPRDLNEMLDVRGMGTAKVGKYGEKFLQVIRVYEAAHPRTASTKTVITERKVTVNTTPRRRAPVNTSTERKVTVKSKPMQAGQRWDAAEDTQLRREYLDGISVAELSAAHNRTRSAIRSRLKKLGLIFDGDAEGEDE